MKNMAVNQKLILLMLMTALLMCWAQGVSHGGAVGEVIGGIGSAIGAVGTAVGVTLGAAGTALGIAVGTVLIAVGAVDLGVSLIDTVTFFWHTGSLSSMAVIPNVGTIGVVASNLIYLGDSYTVAPHTTLTYSSTINSIAFSPTGPFLASGSVDNTVQLWNHNTQTLLSTLRGHTDSVASVVFSPDGSLLASGSADGTVRLWNPITDTLLSTLQGHTSDVLSIAFSPDGSLLASGGADGTVRLWNPVTETLEATLEAHMDSVLSVAFSPDGLLLASASADGLVGLWDTHTEILQATLGHESPVLSVAFSPDGDLLATGSADGVARLWAPHVPEHKATLGHESPVESVTFDGSILVTGSQDGSVRQWAITTETAPSSTSQGSETSSSSESQPDGVTASTASPLTETTLDESVVTLTLAGGTYEPSNSRIRNAITVSGIDGVTFRSSDVDRVSDTEVTVELTFNGDFDTDATLTFTVAAGAIANYSGAAFTAQVPVSASTESLVASTAAPLTESTLDESVVTLTLSGRTYESSRYTIARAITVSGIDGVTFRSSDVDRISDTEVTVELTFDGNFQTDSRLIVTVEEGAIAGYSGSAFTAEIPVTAGLEADANNDGVVNTQDLVLVASNYGQTGTNSADINGDGVVNIEDLTTVAGAIDNAGAAPSVQPQMLELFTAADVKLWLSHARQLNLTDPTVLKGVLFLEQLLAVLLPKETVLLPNYPNPFNPETWIPYHLATDADVILTIYDMSGQVVRQFALGYQAAGRYQSRSRAVYWDGRNEFGEQVASGVYFYHLSAGNYSATRKMLILK